MRRSLLMLYGAGVVAGPWVRGWYGVGRWAWPALALLVLGAALVVRDGPPRRWGAVALGGLAGLWLVATLSRLWAADPGATHADAAIWALYAGSLLVLLLCLRGRRDARLLLAGIALAGGALALYVVARLGIGHGRALFDGTRLSDPLGYSNAQGSLLVTASWPLIALAERRRGAAGPFALAGAAFLWSVALATSSRGALLAAVVSAAALIALLPGRLERCWALVALAAPVAICSTLTTSVARIDAFTGSPAASAMHRVAAGALLAALGAGLAWAFVSAAVARWGRSGAEREVMRHRLERATAIGAVLALIAGAPFWVPVAVRGLRQFATGSPTPSGQRLLSGGGTRAGDWRIALEEFARRPLVGAGAGNYQGRYYLRRSTIENVSQPASLELQVLGELGLAGTLPLAAFLIGGLAGLGVAARRRAQSAVTVAAGGVFTAWLAGAAVDWLHLLPGITCAGIAGAAVLTGDMSATSWSRPGAAAGRRAVIERLAVVALLAAMGASVLQPLAGHDRRVRARRLLAGGRPVAALAEARSALSIDPGVLDGYYIEAAALERLGRPADARAALGRAVAASGGENFVPWALAGDLALRSGERATAALDYRHAAALNPNAPFTQIARCAETAPDPRACTRATPLRGGSDAPGALELESPLRRARRFFSR